MHPSQPSDRVTSPRARLLRLLAVLSLALALIAIPTVMPEAASARRMSEGNALRICAVAGGSGHWEFYEDGEASFSCDLPSGNQFFCSPGGGASASIVDCF